MTAPHTVELDDMLTWMADSDRAFVQFASSSHEPKALEVAAGNRLYRVRHGETVVYLGSQPADAVETYNSIR